MSDKKKMRGYSSDAATVKQRKSMKLGRFFTATLLTVITGGLLIPLSSLPSFAAERPGPSPFGKRVRDQTGVNIHFTNPKPGEMEMLSAAGFGVVRMDFGWARTEKTQGVYDFSAYDGLMQQVDRQHLRALFILDYSNPLYDDGLSPHTDEGRAAFARWAVAAVTHFKRRHILWEMWNEPNIHFWKPTPNVDDYTKLALVVGKALRDAAPDETYIGPATSLIPLDFLETCFKSGVLDYFSAVSVHPYRSIAPETVVPSYGQLEQLIAKYAPADSTGKGRKAIPILSGEWGYTNAQNTKSSALVASPALQASYFDRQLLTNISHGVPLTIWYDWHDDYDKPNDAESNFGLVRNPYFAGRSPAYDPKPSYIAARTLLHLIGDYRFEQRLAMPGAPDASVLSFGKGRQRIYALWSTAASPQTVTLPIPGGEYTIFDQAGATTGIVKAEKAGLPITINGDVQFVVRGRRSPIKG